MSQASMSAVWFLRHNKIDCCLLEVDLLAGEQKSEKFRLLNATGEVPTLHDGETVISQSSAILVYLSGLDREEEGAVCFDAKMEFAARNEWQNACEHRARVNEYVGRHHTYVRCFTTECFSRILFCREAVRARERKAALARVQPQLALWERILSTQTHIVGRSLSICDFLFAPEILQLHLINLLPTATYPSLTAYLKRMSLVEGYEDATSEFTRILKEMNYLK